MQIDKINKWIIEHEKNNKETFEKLNIVFELIKQME